MKNKVLIVEDSTVILKILKHIAKQILQLEPIFATSMAEAQSLYQQHKEELFAGIIDLALPDAPNGEMVTFLLEEKFPVVVLTGSYDENKRASLVKQGVVDYVVKESRYSYCYAVNMLNRLYKNQQIQVLVVEDSKQYRKHIVRLLTAHKYQVLEAEDGLKAMEQLKQNPEIKMVITDYNMPEMDGFELVQAIRRQYEKSDMIIIGLSGEDGGLLSIKFIKNGADDFLNKPFQQEEFYCRITNNIESLEQLHKIQDQANRDYLTSLYNRRYFCEQGELLLKQANKSNTELALVSIDIDFFKSVNDEYGHEAGDEVLKFFARAMESILGRFLVARIGGEEFCIVVPGLSNEKVVNLIDGFKQHVAAQIIDVSDDEILRISFSAGVTNIKLDNINGMLNQADEYLYRAKEAGRNMVIGDE
ncbi:diguanylate cyclase response regulator [Oleispira antarctica]|uniref:diguanylate cyclase n=1 Tax=Oleispira antarctica TaxID=188908 RepID=A0A1Y5HSR2_OLEAN|nr:diguanylate cyclase response regulator [Oleispira antarctica]